MFDALPPPRRRAARGLTDEDRALWRAFVARGVVPLRARGAPEDPPAPPAADPAGGGMATAPAAPSGGAARPAPSAPRPPPALPLNAPPPGLDARRWRDLRRGNTRPERTLDLHGLRAAEAHAAVRAFLHAAQAEGLRCVAIVTGRGAGPEGGVLRRELPHWLEAPELRGLLLGAAHPHAARGGAVHLLLRRRRPGRGAAPAGARRR
ncbi:hypothetical protein GCM10010964_19730 [Caldovatus sediminis]|uniref:Smr domain-containing protein n=1 Tax=Caldovatus sediminis TaxID=2041189 RepID=A0A8J3EC25_9PROT|nr:Smr/MutS family protein [Caldovatus sediminis]GGG31856.1 hypothetical protein GCM10010964_19730 [Caldovatus sediminis]